MFDTSPVVVISFITAVMAFYIMYFLPVMMTFKVGDYISKTIKKSSEEADPSLENKLINHEKDPSTDSSNEEVEEVLSSQKSLSNITKWEKILYVGVLSYGTIMLVLELISFFV